MIKSRLGIEYRGLDTGERIVELRYRDEYCM